MGALSDNDRVRLSKASQSSRQVGRLTHDGLLLRGPRADDWLMDRRNRRAIPHRMERCRYVPVRNPDADDGLWKLEGKRQAVYAKASMSLREQIAAVRKLTANG